MTTLTKSQRKHLQQIAEQCYEKEMSLALEALYEHFQEWKKSELTPWDLNDKIHEYHNKTARELWKSYEQMNDPAFVVSMALAKGIIKIEDVEKIAENWLDEWLRPTDFCRKNAQRQNQPKENERAAFLKVQQRG